MCRCRILSMCRASSICAGVEQAVDEALVHGFVENRPAYHFLYRSCLISMISGHERAGSPACWRNRHLSRHGSSILRCLESHMWYRKTAVNVRKIHRMYFHLFHADSTAQDWIRNLLRHSRERCSRLCSQRAERCNPKLSNE
jgi:hypothetical protein